MALDPRTRLMLYKLVNSGAITEVHGTISTGKESVVVYAKGENNLEFLSHGNLSVNPGNFRLRAGSLKLVDDDAFFTYVDKPHFDIT